MSKNASWTLNGIEIFLEDINSMKGGMSLSGMAPHNKKLIGDSENRLSKTPRSLDLISLIFAKFILLIVEFLSSLIILV